MAYDEARLLEACTKNHLAEEPFFCSLELTNELIYAISYHSQIPAHKVYFKYDNYKKVTGLEIEATPTLQWIDSFSVFYDFPKTLKDRIYKLFPNKVFASIHNGKQTLSPDSDE